jgi:hypothetical protein
MIKHIGASVLALGLLLSVGAIATPAQAASLTSAQVSAIIGLLQSFGADQGTINNVSAALGGSSTGGTLSCSSFADLSYGDFDTSPGGRVSQLQTWLGISSSSFGFGTYGPKTQAAWSAKCGGTQTTSTQSTSANFTVSPTSGIAPLAVTFSGTVSTTNPSSSGGIGVDAPYIDFGDGQGGTLSYGEVFCPTPYDVTDYIYPTSCTFSPVSHTYTLPGTYTAVLHLGVQKGSDIILGTVTVTVTGSNATQPSATIDQSSLTAFAGAVTLTGAVSGVGLVEVYLVRTDGYAYGDGTLGTDHGATVANNRWSFTARSLPAGTYTVTVRLSDMPSGSLPAGATLTTGTLTVTGSNTNQPSATVVNVSTVQQPTNTIAPQGAIVPFTKFSISNTGSSDVTLSSMQFKQVGSGSDAAFRAIEVTDDAGGDVMVPNYPDGTLFNSGHITSAVAPFVVYAGQTKTFTVSGWMQSNLSAYSGGLVSLSLLNVGSTAGVTVNGLLGITGATDTVNSAVNVCYPPQTAVYGYKCWSGN